MTPDLADLDTRLGRHLAVACADASLDPRTLSAAVFHGAGAVHGESPAASERAAVWDGWSPARRAQGLRRIAALLDQTWPIGCTAATIAASLHRHLGDLAGELTVEACRHKELSPDFTKPLRAFWTCPVVPGTGPVGFETLIRELNPQGSYASWDVRFGTSGVRVVDRPADWDALVAETGADPQRSATSPRWDLLDADAVHVTNGAIIRSFADGATPLWDWGLEQTAWFRPCGTYIRLSETEPWQDAVARLSGR